MLLQIYQQRERRKDILRIYRMSIVGYPVERLLDARNVLISYIVDNLFANIKISIEQIKYLYFFKLKN